MGIRMCINLSQSFGQAISLLHSFNTTQVDTFTSHSSGAYVIALTNGAAFYGSVAVDYLAQISGSRNDGRYLPFFDYNGDLYELVYKSDSLYRNPINPFNIILEPSACIYSHVSFQYNENLPERYMCSNLNIIRIYIPNKANYKAPDNEINSISLPSEIILDYLDEFDFKMYLKPTDWTSTDNLIVNFQLNLGFKRDSKSPDLMSILTILIPGSQLTCEDKYPFKKIVPIYSGCSRTTKMIFKSNISKCQYSKSDVSCAWYGDEFHPQLYISDLYLNSNFTYPGDYHLSIVGGGHSQSSIVRYSTKNVEKYNPSNKSDGIGLIWIPSDGKYQQEVIFGPSSLSLSWRCRVDSPCYGVSANEFGEPNIYYFILQVTAVNYTSYCDFQSEFTIALLNIPISFEMQLIYVFSAMVVCVMFLGLYLWFSETATAQSFLSDFSLPTERETTPIFTEPLKASKSILRKTTRKVNPEPYSDTEALLRPEKIIEEEIEEEPEEEEEEGHSDDSSSSENSDVSDTSRSSEDEKNEDDGAFYVPLKYNEKDEDFEIDDQPSKGTLSRLMTKNLTK
ncbi:hypothetical protein BC833DRAFT_567919 [Globomyces pollinis-pini]|nr:hypothetical protein BC833DRAFT_567919 [Globomyces pollinis-pini]